MNKKEKITTLDEDEQIVFEWTAEIKLDSKMNFYCQVPDELLDAIPRQLPDGVKPMRGGSKKPNSYGSTTYQSLRDFLWEITHDAFKAEETVEKVILYRILCPVMYAEDKDGNVLPNASYPGASWVSYDSFRYSDTSNNRLEGPFLSVEAGAFLKTTRAYKSRAVVRYESYYGEGRTHHDREHPAARLNQWNTAHGLVCKYAKKDEMPYSDEAAIYWYNIHEQMMKLTRSLHLFMGTPDKVQSVVAQDKLPF